MVKCDEIKAITRVVRVFIKNKIRKMFSWRKEHFADLGIECGFILNPIVYAVRLTVLHR